MTLDNVLLEPTLNTVKGLMIMDNNGVRILSKYYDPEIFPTIAAEKKFEKTLFQKTHKVKVITLGPGNIQLLISIYDFCIVLK